MINKTLLACFILLTFAGCYSNRQTQPPPQFAEALIPEASIRHQFPEPQVRQPTPAPARIQSAPVPVWREAQVQRVEVAPYVNERGEAFPATFKYVVVEGGGFNSAALENPELGYIPAENMPRIPNSRGMSYTPMVSPGTGAIVRETPSGRIESNLPVADFYDMDDILILGLVEASQNVEAQAMLPEDYIAIFDESLGWIGVPRSHLMGVEEIRRHAGRG